MKKIKLNVVLSQPRDLPEMFPSFLIAFCVYAIFAAMGWVLDDGGFTRAIEIGALMSGGGFFALLAELCVALFKNYQHNKQHNQHDDQSDQKGPGA